MVKPTLLVLALYGCAHDVRTRFPADPETVGDAPATLVLRFTHAVEHAYVSVNGVPVAQDAHTKEIVVEGLPPGETTVMVAAANGLEKGFMMHLSPGQRAVVPLSAADTSVGRSVFQAFLTAAVYAAYLGLAAVL